MKKHAFRILSTLLILCMVLALLPSAALAAEAYPVTGGNIYYVANWDNTGWVISSCDDGVTEAVIPSEIDGRPVVGIGNNALSGAFRNKTNLTRVTIPDSVTYIMQGSFWGCSNLTSVNIPNGITRIESQTFINCENLTNITIPDSVTLIGYAAFTGCRSLKSLTIPKGVTTLDMYAISDCEALTSITIPASVTTIGLGFVAGCYGLTEINVESGSTSFSSVDGVLFNVDHTKIVTYPGGKAGDTYTIPNTVTSIGESAFQACPNLISMTIPDTVTSIESGAFINSANLARVAIPTTITEIPYAAFNGCTSLKDIYYAGSEEQWNAIDIYTNSSSNGPLLRATKHFNSTMPGAPDEPETPDTPDTPDNPPPDIVFTDVSKDGKDWYRDFVYNAANKGLINGNSDGSFKPENTIIRAEFLALIVRLVNGGDPAKAEDMSKWYDPHYAYAADHGLLEGLPEDADKEGDIPRYEMAQLIYNAAKSKGLDVESASKDFYESNHSYSESYDAAIRYAYGVGLFSGKGDNGDFVGADTLKRSEAAKVIWLFYEMAEQA